MADNKKDAGNPDISRINVYEQYELNYWTKKFGITAADLKKAVRNAGTIASNVEAYLKKNM